MSVVVAPLHYHVTPGRLVRTAEEMGRRGSPVVRAFWDEKEGVWLAMEGTHRLLVAHAMGVVPVMVPVRWWRTRRALERARFAAVEYGHVFPAVAVARF